MSTATTVALSQQMALRRTLDVIANNLANLNTTAFKSETVLFEEYLMEVDGPSGPQSISYVIDQGIDRNLAQGHQVFTDNQFDFAVNGEGYFVVDTPNGERYTRNGHFILDERGQLITKEGFPVLSVGGAPITFQPTDEEVAVSADGTISTSNGLRGQLSLVTFEDEDALLKEGDSLFNSEEAPVAVALPSIMQGYIEQSNVSPIMEMTKMIDVMRAYQSAATLSETNNDLTRKAIDELSSV